MIELIGNKFRIAFGTLTGILFALGLVLLLKGILIGLFLLFPVYLYFLPTVLYDLKKYHPSRR